MALPEENASFRRWHGWRSAALEHLQRGYQRLNQASGGWLSLLADTWRAFHEDDGGTHAAAIGYYALFSLFPLIVLLSLALTFLVGETTAQIQVMLIVGRYLPTSLSFVSEIVQNVLENRGTLSALAFVGVAWGSIHIFRVLERSINQAWGAPRRRNFWAHLRFSLTMITITGILTLLSILATGVFRLSRSRSLPYSEWAPLENSLVWAFVSAIPPFALSVVLLLLLYRFVPHGVRVRWSDVIPSAVLGAFLWEVAKHIFAFYLGHFVQNSYNLLYGSVGVVIAILTWVYLVAHLILLGAELSAVLHRTREM
jgi:membrane protein